MKQSVFLYGNKEGKKEEVRKERGRERDFKVMHLVLPINYLTLSLSMDSPLSEINVLII